MKNFSTNRRLLAPVAPALAVMLALSQASCSRIEQPGLRNDVSSAEESCETNDLSPESVARMLAGLPLTVTQAREVFDAVSASLSNGYDEEYPFVNILERPGSGVGDDLILTRSSVEYSEPLGGLLASAAPLTRAGSFTDALSASGLQIYWPYSEDWDGKTLPVITFDPGDSQTYSLAGRGDASNVGFHREQLPSGAWIVKEVTVDEEYARSHPVWVVNRNEDAAYMTPQMLVALHPELSASQATRSYSDTKTLVLKEFKAHRNYDSWFAGGSEFFVKCGALDGFTARTEEELKLYSPSVTDMMINVRRKQVGKTLRFNTILVSEWTPQLDECVFLMIEDDGGKQTSWKANGLVKIKSKSYGFEVELPFRRNDDLVWRGKLSRNYFEKYNGKPNRFGDVSVTFSFL